MLKELVIQLQNWIFQVIHSKIAYCALVHSICSKFYEFNSCRKFPLTALKSKGRKKPIPCEWNSNSICKQCGWSGVSLRSLSSKIMRSTKAAWVLRKWKHERASIVFHSRPSMFGCWVNTFIASEAVSSFNVRDQSHSNGLMKIYSKSCKSFLTEKNGQQVHEK